MNATRSYFAGETPANGTWCEPDVKTFPKLEDEASLYSTLSIEDRKILDAGRKIGEYFTGAKLSGL
jgi:hypothetical protein